MRNVIILTCCLIFPINILAGGTVYFENRPVFVGDDGARFFDEKGVPLSGTNYLTQMYVGISESALVKIGSPVPFFDKALSGYFNGGELEIPFVRAGGCAWIQIRAWEAVGGSTFEKAALAKRWTGISSMLYVHTGGAGAPPTIPTFLFGLKYPGNPIIVYEPQNRKLRSGNSTEISLIASGGVTLSYQWYHGESGDTNQPVVGATNAVLHTSPITTNNRYWANASTAVGSTNSTAATVTVFPTSTVFLDLGIVDGLPHLGIDLPSVGPVEIQSWDGNGSPKWDVLSTVLPSTNPFTFVDSSATNDSARFYRVVRP